MHNTRFPLNISQILSAICLLGICLYANALNSRYQFDDYPVIVNNPLIKSEQLSSLWTSGQHPTRILPYITFALNYRISGLNPFGYHVVNILIHLINALLVFQLIRLIFQTPVIRKLYKEEAGIIIAAVCALFFISHPIQTESVTYITQRFTSLATLFYLAALCFFLKGRLVIHSEKRQGLFLFIMCGLCAVGGMLSKQIALTIPLIILIMEGMFFDEKSKRAWFFLVIPAVIFLLFIPAMYVFDVGGILSIRHNSGSHDGDLITSQSYALTQPRVILTYIQLLFFPVQQNLLYDFPVSTSLFDGKTVLSLITIAAIVFSAFRFLKINPLYSFGIFWFFITLSVESTIIPIRHVIFEHRLYLPSIGFFLSMIAVLFRLFERKSMFVAVSIVLVLILSVLTIQRNLVWKDGVAMWKDVVGKSPHQARPYYNLGYEYLKNNDLNPALQNFSKAIDINPNYFDAYNNRSQVYLEQGKLDKAFYDINQAIKIDEQRAEAYLNRGMIIRQMGQYNLAIKDLNRAIELDSKNHVYYTNRALTYGNLAQYDSALKDLNQALEFNPKYAQAYTVRGAIYMNLSRPTDALNDFNKAILYGPSEINAYNNRVQLRQLYGQYELANEDLSKMIELQPNSIDTYLTRAFNSAKLGKLDDAIKDFNLVLQKNPNQFEVHMEKGKIYYRQMRYRLALDEFDAVLNHAPKNAFVYFLRGLCHYELTQYKDALSDINQAKELGHSVDESYFIRINQALNQTEK
ncbi:MAG: tetratricopeptide repeat protein [Candidatus Omnitrophica bacterium]|nr:tetratricopeptide repeat protein [Candidatus Omnitrophota bacterium]